MNLQTNQFHFMSTKSSRKDVSSNYLIIYRCIAGLTVEQEDISSKIHSKPCLSTPIHELHCKMICPMEFIANDTILIYSTLTYINMLFM